MAFYQKRISSYPDSLMARFIYRDSLMSKIQVCLIGYSMLGDPDRSAVEIQYREV